MIKLVTFTDDRMTISAQKCAESAMKHGADSYSIWTPDDLPQDFKEKMKKVLDIEFGAGLYCWKARIVWEEINRLNDGDVLIYCDAGNEWVSNITPAVNGMKEDCLFFSNGWPNGDWCKMDVINALILDDQREIFIKTPQLQASTFFIRVNAKTKLFMAEWLKNCTIEHFIDNSPSREPNVSTFQETRWDQSILSALAFTFGYPLRWFPTTTAHHMPMKNEAWYPVLLNHHRRRNDQW